MHPAIVIVLEWVVRCCCIAAASFRVLGLGLAGASGTSWQFLPAMALFYFALAPKPGAFQWKFAMTSGLVFVVGLAALGRELYIYPREISMFECAEVGLLLISMVRHITHAFGGSAKERQWPDFRSRC